MARETVVSMTSFLNPFTQLPGKRLIVHHQDHAGSRGRRRRGWVGAGLLGVTGQLLLVEIGQRPVQVAV
jgi:hypothetical protein